MAGYLQLDSMKPVASKPQLFKQPRPESPLKVVFAYEDDAALCAAMEIYRGVAGRLTDQYEFQIDCWRFDDLVEPASFDRAVVLAAGADMVFCCPGNPHVLPRLALDWIQQWLIRRTQTDGVLALLSPISAGTSIYPTLLERDLRETARACGLDFLATHYLTDHATRPVLSSSTPPVNFETNLTIVYENGRRTDPHLGRSANSGQSSSDILKTGKRNDVWTMP